MASIKHSTPKVSAYSVYTRNKKLTEVAEKKVEQAKPAERKLTNISQRKGVPANPVVQTKTKNSNLDIKTSALRKRKNDIVTKVNGTATEEQVVKKKRGRKKKVVQEETPHHENSPSDNEEVIVELEENESEHAYEDVERISFETSAVPVSNGVSNKQIASCGNEAAEEAFRWLISPAKPEFFFEKIFEKEPFLIQRSNSNYYKGLYSTKEFERTVKENYLNYDKEIDVVAYVDGKRNPIKEETRVFASNLWSHFHAGYSLRMRNPQVYHKPLGSLCSLLQEYFASFVGANMYLTPEDSQGFPPHYDDIDAFILQIEGKKLWKLYTPSEIDMLARFSSPDLSEDDLDEPCMEVELNPGDMLYFPRGFIHQAKTVPGVHSLHITLSTNQLNTWGDLLQLAFESAIETATENNIEFRKSIPKDYLDYMGSVHLSYDSKERKDFKKIADGLIQKSLDYISLDVAADRQSRDFIYGSMPPFINEKEKARSAYGNGSRFVNGKIVVSQLLSSQTKIRFIRKRAVRLIVDEEGAKLHHTLNNSLNHKEKENLFIEVDLTCVPALTELFRTHPDYVKIKDLPLGNSPNLLDTLQLLYENGFLMTEEPLPPEKD